MATFGSPKKPAPRYGLKSDNAQWIADTGGQGGLGTQSKPGLAGAAPTGPSWMKDPSAGSKFAASLSAATKPAPVAPAMKPGPLAPSPIGPTPSGAAMGSNAKAYGSTFVDPATGQKMYYDTQGRGNTEAEWNRLNSLGKDNPAETWAKPAGREPKGLAQGAPAADSKLDWNKQYGAMLGQLQDRTNRWEANASLAAGQDAARRGLLSGGVGAGQGTLAQYAQRDVMRQANDMRLTGDRDIQAQLFGQQMSHELGLGNLGVSQGHLGVAQGNLDLSRARQETLLPYEAEGLNLANTYNKGTLDDRMSITAGQAESGRIANESSRVSLDFAKATYPEKVQMAKIQVQDADLDLALKKVDGSTRAQLVKLALEEAQRSGQVGQLELGAAEKLAEMNESQWPGWLKDAIRVALVGGGALGGAVLGGGWNFGAGAGAGAMAGAYAGGQAAGMIK